MNHESVVYDIIILGNTYFSGVLQITEKSTLKVYDHNLAVLS